MSKLLTALLAGAALTLSGTLALAADQSNAQHRDNQTQAQPDSTKGQSGQSHSNSNQSGQSGNANRSAYDAEQDVIAKMKCENLSGQQQKDCMAKVKNKAQLDKQHDQSNQAGAGGNTSQSTGARAGADPSAGANSSQSAGVNRGETSSKAGANAGANSSQSAGTNAGGNASQSAGANAGASSSQSAGATAPQEGPASREQEVIAKMKCNSMSGKQKDDCMTAAKKKAGQM